MRPPPDEGIDRELDTCGPPRVYRHAHRLVVVLPRERWWRVAHGRYLFAILLIGGWMGGITLLLGLSIRDPSAYPALACFWFFSLTFFGGLFLSGAVYMASQRTRIDLDCRRGLLTVRAWQWRNDLRKRAALEEVADVRVGHNPALSLQELQIRLRDGEVWGVATGPSEAELADIAATLREALGSATAGLPAGADAHQPIQAVPVSPDAAAVTLDYAAAAPADPMGLQALPEGFRLTLPPRQMKPRERQALIVIGVGGTAFMLFLLSQLPPEPFVIVIGGMLLAACFLGTTCAYLLLRRTVIISKHGSSLSVQTSAPFRRTRTVRCDDIEALWVEPKAAYEDQNHVEVGVPVHILTRGGTARTLLMARDRAEALSLVELLRSALGLPGGDGSNSASPAGITRGHDVSAGAAAAAAAGQAAHSDR